MKAPSALQTTAATFFFRISMRATLDYAPGARFELYERKPLQVLSTSMDSQLLFNPANTRYAEESENCQSSNELEYPGNRHPVRPTLSCAARMRGTDS